jgi:hypothetical protein
MDIGAYSTDSRAAPRSEVGVAYRRPLASDARGQPDADNFNWGPPPSRETGVLPVNTGVLLIRPFDERIE